MEEDLPRLYPVVDCVCKEEIEWIGLINYESILSISLSPSQNTFESEMVRREHNYFESDKDIFGSSVVYYGKSLHQKQRSQNITIEEIEKVVEKQINPVFEELKRIRNDLSGLSKGFGDIRDEMMKLNNEEGLKKVKEEWLNRMTRLEGLIKSSNCDEKKLSQEMRNLERSLLLKIEDLNMGNKFESIETLMIAELVKVKEELIEANKDRLRGEVETEEKIVLILEELKSIQSQLNRVEEKVNNIFKTMENTFCEIRKELVESSKKEELKELRDLWVESVYKLEELVMSRDKSNGSNISDLMDEIEIMMDDKLLDLDLKILSISPQLDDVKQQLQEVLGEIERGEENSENKMKLLLDELKSLQNQLTE